MAGGFNLDDYFIPLDNTLRIYNPGPGSNMNVLGVAPGAIAKAEIDGVTLTTNAQGQIMVNLANPNTWTALQTFVNPTTSLMTPAAIFQAASIAAIFQATNAKPGIPVVVVEDSSGNIVASIGSAGNAIFNGTITTHDRLNVDAPALTLSGTTAGSITYYQPFQGSSLGKFIAYANGYENDTTTAQTITFPNPFTTVANVTFNNTGLSLSTSLTTLTISAPNNTTTYTGMIIVEGF